MQALKSMTISFALWAALILMLGVFFQTISLQQLALLTLLLCGSFITGANAIFLLRQYINTFSSFSLSGISVLIGLFLCIPTLFFPDWLTISYIFLLFVGSAFWGFKNYYRHAFSVKLEPLKWSLLFLFTSLLAVAIINHTELMKLPYVHHVFTSAEKNPDSAFFTSIVATYGGDLKQGAVYEVGSPIDYNIFAYLFPAVIKKLAGVSAFVAYNSIFNLFSYTLFYLLLIDLSRLLLSNIVSDLSALYYSLVPLSYILLVPINPKGILNLDFEGIIWGGSGFIAPGGNLGSSFALLITLLSLIWYFTFRNTSQEKSIRYLLGLLITSFFLMATKVTFFVAFIIFISLDRLLLLFKERGKRQLQLFVLHVSIFLANCLAFILFGRSTDGGTELSVHYSYLVSSLNMLHLDNIVAATLFAFFILFFWLATRLVVALYVWRAILFRELFSISIGLVLATSLFPLLLNIQITKFGTQVDKTFDLMQFLRAGYLYMSILASVAIPLCFFYHKKAIGILTLFLLIFAGGNHLKRILSPPEIDKKQTLYYSGYEEVIRDELTAIYPIDNFNSIQIASTGKFSVYSAMSFSGNGGYNSGSIHPERWENLQNLENSKSSVDTKLTPLIEDNVKYLIILKEHKPPFDELETVFENEAVAIQKLR